VLQFTQRFNKLYNKIPAEVKPSQPSAKVTYASDFDPDFALLLRERRSVDLSKMQDDAVEIVVSPRPSPITDHVICKEL
jgi:hypothetical protein